MLAGGDAGIQGVEEALVLLVHKREGGLLLLFFLSAF
jgi:hypothetical protein